MHSMHVHLGIAKRLNEVLKKEENSLYVGSVIADIDKFTDKKSTHFQSKELINGVSMLLPNYKEFTKKYKEKLDNPVYLGYLIHLMTDYFFNKTTFSNYWLIENGIIVGAKLNTGNIRYGDSTSRKRFRLNDYSVFDNYIEKTGGYGIPEYSEELYQNIKKFKLITLEKDDVFAVIESIHLIHQETIMTKIFKKKYKLYTNETMGNTFEECIKFILDYLKEESII